MIDGDLNPERAETPGRPALLAFQAAARSVVPCLVVWVRSVPVDASAIVASVVPAAGALLTSNDCQ
jgi:hypothetical protein